MNPNTDEAGGCEESEDEESSESSSLDANMLRSKFASLASTLQQTNQNLVTFEYLLENNKKVRKLTESPKVGGGGEAEEDIVNLLKDICGSVQDLRTEMGQNTAAESKNPDLDQNKERCLKLELECANLKSQLARSEERLEEEKRKTVEMEHCIQEQKSQLRKLDMYLKEADEFSKESGRECHFLKEEMLEMKHHLKLESEQKEALKTDLERVKKLNAESESSDGERKMGKVVSEFEAKIELEKEKNKKLLSDLRETKDRVKELEAREAKESVVSPLELEVVMPTTSRSTISSKSEKTYDELKDSHRRLKQKTRQLLKQYRAKRGQLERKERQLTLQKAGLMKLQSLHQSVETNHYVVIHHLGQQIVQIAKLVGTLWPDSQAVMEELYRERENKLSDWILYIDNLSSWIVQKLVQVSVKKRSVVKSSLETSLAQLETCKTSITEAAKNEDSQLFKNIQRELVTGLEEEKTDADTSIGTWM